MKKLAGVTTVINILYYSENRQLKPEKSSQVGKPIRGEKKKELKNMR